MGFHPCNMTRSPKLKKLVEACEACDDYEGWWSDEADGSSTAGYDNDGSIGPELVDMGIGLGSMLKEDGKVFFAFGDSCCYYQIGKDEDDAVSRLETQLKAAAETNKLPYPPVPSVTPADAEHLGDDVGEDEEDDE